MRARIASISIVSTDSDRIGRIAARYGAAYEFRRPARYATSRAVDYQVMRHAVLAYERRHGVRIDVLVMLHATTPTTTAGDIRACLRRVGSGDCDAAVTVCRVDDRPEWCGTVNAGGRFRRYFTSGACAKMARVRWFMPSGGVYVARRDAYFREKTFFTRRCAAVEVPPERIVDIDTLRDFRFAEFLFARRRGARR